MEEPRKSWVVVFRRGITDFDLVTTHPNGSQGVVVAGGRGYIVDAGRRHVELMEDFDITAAFHVPENGVLVLVIGGVLLQAIDATGVRWRTRRISWDGLRDLHSAEGILTGEAWDPLGGKWQAFAVDVRNGDVQGGTYHATGGSWAP
jgi:hypothetical protein